VIKHLPNTITLLNLGCGFLAILAIFQGNLLLAFWLVLVAGVLDFLDGFLARLLKAYSNIGKDLDSLADCVTFGVVPGFFLMRAMTEGTCNCFTFPSELPWEAYFALGVPMMSALRLAIFNNDTRQTDSFIGVPTPANTLFIVSLICVPILAPDLQWVKFIKERNFLLGVSLVCSAWLVMPVPLLALKFKNYTWQENSWRFTLIGLSIVMVAINYTLALPAIVLLYIGLSVIKNILKK
jgi:CDP-diacylglycerol--serine O-phosphatidyltransferase